METSTTFKESEFEAKFPVYSKINHITCDNNYNGFTHDYVDLDDRQQVTPPLTSSTMEYCAMSPLSAFLPNTQEVEKGGLSKARQPPRRSLSIGPVADIHAYRRKRQGSDTTNYVDSYLNNFMVTRNLRADHEQTKITGQTENQGHLLDGYRSWQPGTGGKNGHKSDFDPEIRARCEDPFLGDKEGKASKICKINRRSLAYSLLFLVLLALAVSLTVKTIDGYGLSQDIVVEDEEVELLVSSKDSGRRKYFDKKQCCQKLKISSGLFLSKFYPDLVGVYENIQKESNHKNPIFKNTNQNRFLFKPVELSRPGMRYAWGVSSSPTNSWGWLKAVASAECPEDVRYWRVYQEASSSWVLDTGLTVTCTSIL